jgi:hypothetical protein
MKPIALAMTATISQRVLTGLLLAALALGLVGVGGAQAQDNVPQEPGSMPCTPPGSDGPPTIPEETVIKIGDSYYQCIRGQWWKLPSPPKAATLGTSADQTSNPVKTRLRVASNTATLFSAD